MKISKSKSNSGGVSVLLLVVGGLISAVVIAAVFLVSTYNDAVRQESGIVAAHEDMQNVHTSIFNQMRSQGIAVEKYGEMVIQALNVAMTGRYGKTGSQAAMQWIQEQNPNIDPTMFGKLQTAIEAGYNKFESAQRSKIDRIRVYDNLIESAFYGDIVGVMGFPKRVTADMRKTITSEETEGMMSSKKMKTIDPFHKG